MSAFLVSKKTIDAIVLARTIVNRKCHSRLLDGVNDHQFGAMLWAENVASLRARYRDNAFEDGELADVQQYTYARTTEILALGTRPLILIKQIRCYRYQSCEHEGWKESEACKVTEYLEDALVTLIDGYDDAPWGLR